MGSGIEGARGLSPEAAAAMENMRDQLLIVMLRRLGGKLTVDVAEIDATGDAVLMMGIVDRTFTFTLVPKGRG